MKEKFKNLPLRNGVGIVVLNNKNEVFVAKTTPIETDGKKPKGVKRLNDLINFDVDIPKLIRHLD